MSEKQLIMSFEANTIQHLGVKMYSTIPPALAELIANSYDACATEVYVKLYDGTEKKVIVQDNGIGMSFDQVNDYFLRIGRKRRVEQKVSARGIGQATAELFNKEGAIVLVSDIRDTEGNALVKNLRTNAE